MNSNPSFQMKRLLLFNLATDIDDPFLGFTTHWIRELASLVAAIDVITMRAGHIEVPENVTVYSVGKEKGYSEFRRVIEFYRILLPLVSRYRYDGCFAHMMPLFAVMAAPILRLKKIPIVLWYAHKSVTPMLRVAERLVHRTVTSTKEGFRLQSSKVRIIGQGIETERFVPKNKEVSLEHPFTLLTVGRLSPIKQIEVLIEAVGCLKKQTPESNIHLKIVGGPLTESDRDYAAALYRQAAQAHIQTSVTFVGNIPFAEIVEYYQQSDCFINLCPTGAIDKVVLEAMSCGVIPLVSNRSFSEMFDPELEKICLIEPDVQQLAERIKAVCALPAQQRHKLGDQLRSIVIREHDLHALCLKIVNEFKRDEKQECNPAVTR